MEIGFAHSVISYVFRHGEFVEDSITRLLSDAGKSSQRWQTTLGFPSIKSNHYGFSAPHPLSKLQILPSTTPSIQHCSTRCRSYLRLCIVSHWDMKNHRCLHIFIVGMAGNVAHDLLLRTPLCAVVIQHARRPQAEGHRARAAEPRAPRHGGAPQPWRHQARARRECGLRLAAPTGESLSTEHDLWNKARKARHAPGNHDRLQLRWTSRGSDAHHTLVVEDLVMVA